MDRPIAAYTLKNLKDFHAQSKMNVALRGYLANFFLNEEFERGLSKVFQKLDKNHDGTLTKEELMGVNEILGEKGFLMEDEIENIIKMADGNDNGVIDYSEFLSAACSLNQLLSEK